MLDAARMMPGLSYSKHERAVWAVRITRGDETLVEAALENRRFRWPSGSRALRPGTQYDLVFTFKEQGTKPRTLAFLTDPGGTVVEPRLTLITVE